MTSKDDGTYTATYAYKYADKLASISTDFPDESIISFDYGGDGKRREYTTGGNTNTWYWDAGWNVINFETYTGSKFTFVRDPASATSRLLAKWNGTNPTGDGTIWRYYHHDIIDSTRMGTRDDKSIVKSYEYTPYGEIYSESGWANTRWKFTSAHGPSSGLYYFPFRMYSPSLGRWMIRDPLGMLGGPNLYPYCRGNPTSLYDPDGRSWIGAVVGAIIGVVGGAVAGVVHEVIDVVVQGQSWNWGTVGNWMAVGAGMGAVVGAFAGMTVGDLTGAPMVWGIVSGVAGGTIGGVLDAWAAWPNAPEPAPQPLPLPQPDYWVTPYYPPWEAFFCS